jgi:hypothetical protein
MTFRFRLISVLLLCVTTLPALAQERQWGRPRPPRMGACFYREAGFSGDYFCLKVGERWPVMPPGFNDKITSIRVFNGARVRLFQVGNFQGNSLRVDNDVDTLVRFRLRENPSKTWNDRASSIAVYQDHDDFDRGHR